MHLFSKELNFLGGHGIVGAHIPLGTGAAFASKYRGEDRVTLCIFGEGAVNNGAFHESLNLAAIWRLPAVFVCENNLYGEYSPIASTTPIERLADRAISYGMASSQVDGNDVLAVREVVWEAAERGRAGEGPTLIEALTYRQRGHSRTDPAAYRPDGELERWLERDPILLFERALVERGVATANELATVRTEVEREIKRISEEVRTWPDPRPEARFEDVLV